MYFYNQYQFYSKALENFYNNVKNFTIGFQYNQILEYTLLYIPIQKLIQSSRTLREIPACILVLSTKDRPRRSSRKLRRSCGVTRPVGLALERWTSERWCMQEGCPRTLVSRSSQTTSNVENNHFDGRVYLRAFSAPIVRAFPFDSTALLRNPGSGAAFRFSAVLYL